MESVSYANFTSTYVSLIMHWNELRYVQSWIENREVQSEKANLTILFERYVPVLIDAHRTGRFKMITPIQEVHTYILCTLLH